MSTTETGVDADAEYKLLIGGEWVTAGDGRVRSMTETTPEAMATPIRPHVLMVYYTHTQQARRVSEERHHPATLDFPRSRVGLPCSLTRRASMLAQASGFHPFEILHPLGYG